VEMAQCLYFVPNKVEPNIAEVLSIFFVLKY
jgi:hypothetical protein